MPAGFVGWMGNKAFGFRLEQNQNTTRIYTDRFAARITKRPEKLPVYPCASRVIRVSFQLCCLTRSSRKLKADLQNAATSGVAASRVLVYS